MANISGLSTAAAANPNPNKAFEVFFLIFYSHISMWVDGYLFFCALSVLTEI